MARTRSLGHVHLELHLGQVQYCEHVELTCEKFGFLLDSIISFLIVVLTCSMYSRRHGCLCVLMS